MKASADKRLLAAAELISDSAVLADIGTDHAKLPVSLILSGRIKRAFACDINEGPLLFAEALIKERKLEDKITTVLTDGLKGLTLSEITDVSICGMGGELISDILKNSLSEDYSRINFVLNPLTRDDALRRFLAENGFIIEKETAVVQSGRVYSVMKASYNGKPYKKEESWYQIGEIAPIGEGKKYIEKVISRLEKQSKNPNEAEKIARLINEIKEKL